MLGSVRGVPGNRHSYRDQINEIIGDSAGCFSFDKKLEINSYSFTFEPNIDVTGHNLKLASPCVDRGVNVGLIKDYFGNPVPSGAGVDIGPFEYQVDDSLKPPTLKMVE